MPELSRVDRASTRAITELLEIEPGTALYEDAEEQNRRFIGKFNSNPGATLLHVVPAALFMILAPLQFVVRLRARHPAWHRWSGRFLVALAVPIAISGLYFGIVMPFSGRLESSAIALFGTLFLVAAIRGLGVIRAGDVVRHRTWMIRMVAVALGVSSVRIIGMLLALLLREGPDIWFGPSVWLGFGLTVVAGEIWIRRTSPRKERATPLGPRSPSGFVARARTVRWPVRSGGRRGSRTLVHLGNAAFKRGESARRNCCASPKRGGSAGASPSR